MMALLSQGREFASFLHHPGELEGKGIEGRTGKVPVEQRELTSVLLYCLLLSPFRHTSFIFTSPLFQLVLIIILTFHIKNHSSIHSPTTKFSHTHGYLTRSRHSQMLRRGACLATRLPETPNGIVSHRSFQQAVPAGTLAQGRFQTCNLHT